MCSVADVLDNTDPCNPNMGGTEDECYYALAADFAEIPDPPTSETSLLAKWVITDEPTFKQGKCWKRLQMMQDTGKLTYENVGNAGAKQAVFRFSIAGNNPMGQVLNNMADQTTAYVFLVKRNSQPDGRYDFVGGTRHKAKLKGGEDGGEKSGNGDAYNFELMSTQKFEIHYTGDIQLTPQA